MAKRRRNPATIHRDEDTVSDFDFFAGHPGDAPSSPEKPLQRNAANARERARMRVLSKAFVRLKTSLPWVPKDTKLSKLDTLRLAATYIAHLRKVLREDGEEDGCSSARECSTHPVTMSWPYTINSRSNYFDYTPPTSRQENVQNAVDYNQSGVSLEYQNFASCEYLAMDQTNCQRRNTLTHYVQ